MSDILSDTVALDLHKRNIELFYQILHPDSVFPERKHASEQKTLFYFEPALTASHISRTPSNGIYIVFLFLRRFLYLKADLRLTLVTFIYVTPFTGKAVLKQLWIGTIICTHPQIVDIIKSKLAN